MAAQSLLNVAAQTPLAPSNPKTLTLTLTFSSLSFNRSPSSIKHLSFSASHPFALPTKAPTLTSGFARNVAMSSDLDLDDEEYEAPARGRSRSSSSSDLKLFVGNLPFTADNAELTEIFESVGNVESAEVVYDKMTGRSRGFAFVTMSTIEEVEAAAEQLNGYELSGRSLRVNAGPPPPRDEFSSRGSRSPRDDFSSRGSRSPRDDFSSRGSRSPRDEFSSGGYRSSRDDFQSRGSRSPRDEFQSRGSRAPRDEYPSRGFSSGASSDASNRVYVGNLPWSADSMSLETMFSEQGKVMEAKVLYDRESGRSRGFGFVTYSTAAEADSAISSLDGVEVDGRQIRVTVAEEKPKRQY